MANRVPLIINTTANQIQELAVGDSLDLTASGIHNAGVITATKFVGDGSLLTNVTGGGGTSGISDIVEDTTPQLGGNLDINGKIINGSGSIVITGGIQASSFTGPLIGNVTGNVTGNADTATTATTATTANTAGGLTGSPSIQVSSVTVSGNILADTVSVASTLTYEDVTNVDSVGIVTARSGIKVLSNGIDAVGVVTATSFSGDGSALTNLPSDVLNDTTPQLGGNLDLNSKDITGTGNIDITGNASFVDNAKVTFGSSEDLTIKHESNTTYATNITGAFYIQSNDLALRSVSQENYLVATENGAVEIYHNGNKKFETGAQTQLMYGNLELTEGWSIYLKNGFDDASSRIVNAGGSGVAELKFYTQASGGSQTQALHIDGSQNATFAGDINLSEGKKTIFGSNSGSGAYIKHQSGHLEIKNETGNLYWDNLGSIRIRTQTGGTYTNKLEITSDKIMPSVDFKPHAHQQS